MGVLGLAHFLQADRHILADDHSVITELMVEQLHTVLVMTTPNVFQRKVPHAVLADTDDFLAA